MNILIFFKTLNWFLVLKLLFVGFIIYVLIVKVDYHQMITLLSQIKISYLLMALFFRFLVNLFYNFEVGAIVKAFVNKEIPFWKFFEFHFISYFFESFGIGVLGMDSYLWLNYYENLKSKLLSTIIVISDKFLDLINILGFIAIAFISVIIANNSVNYFFWLLLHLPLTFLIGFLFANLVLFTIKIGIYFKSNINKHIIKYITNFDLMNINNKTALLKMIFFTSLVMLSNIIAFSFIVKSLDPSIPYYISFLVVPVMLFIDALPISFQGLGTRELTVSFLFSFLGYDFNTGVIAALSFFFLNLLIGLIAGSYYLLKNGLMGYRAISH